MMIARLLVYAYMSTTVTVQAFKKKNHMQLTATIISRCS